MKLNAFIHENKPGLCVLGIVFGIPLIVISVLSLMFSEGDTGITGWAHGLMGNWAFWFIILGFLVLIPGAYYLYVFIKQLKEFRELMKIETKSSFIKNQDRIEELAWRLHPKYERQVIDRKAKLKIK